MTSSLIPKLEAKPMTDPNTQSREAYLRDNLDVVLRAVMDMAKVGIEVAKQAPNYHTEERDRARIEFIREVCMKFLAARAQPPVGEAVACSDCRGTGNVHCRPFPHGEPKNKHDICATCDGTGLAHPAEPAARCLGSFSQAKIPTEFGDGRVVARPIDFAPRDGTTLRLLIRYSKDEEPGHWTPLEDEFESWTIGHNSFDNTGEDVWKFVGWDWSQDYYLEARGGRVIGWLPFHEAARAGEVVAAEVAEAVALADAAWDERCRAVTALWTARSYVEDFVKSGQGGAGNTDDLRAIDAVLYARPAKGTSA